MRKLYGLFIRADFNTSNVTILPIPRGDTGSVADISIHLMLLFYQRPVTEPKPHTDFNTSNVTILLPFRDFVPVTILFQYI